MNLILLASSAKKQSSKTSLLLSFRNLGYDKLHHMMLRIHSGITGRETLQKVSSPKASTRGLTIYLNCPIFNRVAQKLHLLQQLIPELSVID